MSISKFIAVGENIHCTRSYKVGGKFVQESGDGHVLYYKKPDGSMGEVPVPQELVGGGDWEAGKLRHTAAACLLQLKGDDAGKTAAREFVQSHAKSQEAAGATYLDLNVDEYSTDDGERKELMKWLVGITQEASPLPMSVDSSNKDIIRAGLEECDKERARPLVNSVSLERLDVIDIAVEFNAVVVASAAGESDLPNSVEGRMENIDKIVTILTGKGMALSDIHIDPLVFPISVDGTNGPSFMDTCKAIREKYGEEIHNVAGLSNISFGMPNRKLINQVFARMCVEAGADGGIVDPLHINVDTLNGLDTESEPYKLTKALLTGEDDYGMNYITAVREGKI